MRLLIVEDEKQICDTVAKSLYAAGYEVDTCYDGEEAFECILAENYDLIVLDLNLFLSSLFFLLIIHLLSYHVECVYHLLLIGRH